MPRFLFITLMLLGMHAATAAENWVDTYDALLRKYVTAQGVKYAAWHQHAGDRAALERVVAAIAESPVPPGREEALAFYLNAYNAWTLHNILAKYPTKGPLDGETFFFHGKRIRLEGRKTSLDHLEQKIIRPQFQDARIHFALNCAAQSCPPLFNRAFRGKTLNTDLDALTQDFTRSEEAAEVDRKTGTVRISKIFDWYKEDFASAGGVIPFINKHGDRKINPALKVEVKDYDWSLNEVR